MGVRHRQGNYRAGNATRLQRAVAVLLDNACKYTNAGGTVTVTLRAHASEAVLSVRNSGEPIDEADLPHLFDRFYRADAARTHNAADAENNGGEPGANTGGSDTIGQIISRNTSLPVGSTVMAIDVAVCALSAPVFSIENALYAGLSMVISGYVIDAVVDGGNKRRMVLIISDKFPDIAADIMYGLGRGCTKFKATGMYSGAEKPVIMVIVSRRELNTLKTIVRERDPHAIVTVADVTEAFGEGFKDISA